MIGRLHRNLGFVKRGERSMDSIELTDAMITIMTNAFRMNFLFESKENQGLQICKYPTKYADGSITTQLSDMMLVTPPKRKRGN